MLYEEVMKNICLRQGIFLLLLLTLSPSLWGDTLKKRALKVITAPEVKEMIKEKRTMLINSLTRIEFAIQHIPGSINIPLTEMDKRSSLFDAYQQEIPKDSKLIFYCMGTSCLYSKIASQKALHMGYTQVYWFEGGIPEWYRFKYPMKINAVLKSIRVKKLSPQKVSQLLRDKEILVLDVRPAWWHSKQAIQADTLFMPLAQLSERYLELSSHRPLVISDGLMKQSPSAARFLMEKGFLVLGVLKGGITRWEKEGYPLFDNQSRL